MRIVCRIDPSFFVPILLMVFGFVLGGHTVLLGMINSTDKITITDSDNGRQIHIAPGNILALRLEVIPGTGYSWKLSEDNLTILKALGKPVFEQTKNGKPGATEYQVFQFKALAPGCKTIKLYYLRQWEKDAPPLNTYSIKVKIQ